MSLTVNVPTIIDQMFDNLNAHHSAMWDDIDYVDKRYFDNLAPGICPISVDLIADRPDAVSVY